ncbi:mPR-like GPCR protein [Trichoderma compactum]
MALYRRLSPTGRNETLDDASNSRNENVRTSKTTRRLLTAGEVPSWYAHKLFCFESLWYLHNETLNIYTHLVPAGIAVVGNYGLHLYFGSHYPNASWKDQLVFHIYLSTSIICYGISSLYHMLLCHSEMWSGLWARLDYSAIVFQILGSFISGIYIGFYCEPNLQRLYWTMVCSIVLNWRMLRVFAFVGTGLSAFATIIHAITIFPYDQLDKQAGLRYYYLEGISILTGVVFYITHSPESRIPEKFDVFGASHEIFHSFAVLGGAIHFYGILSAFDWDYDNPRCGL